MSLPRRHASRPRVVGPLAAAGPVEDEVPLFAADAAFARATGGPLTRAFLDALPPAWGDDVVVDSSLVWLTPGLCHEGDAAGRGPLRGAVPFRHEPFPGVDHGVRGASNRLQSAVHRIGVFGLGCCTPLAVEGDIALEPDEDPAGFWVPTQGFAVRDARLEAWIAAGRLTAWPVPVATVVEVPWGGFLRPRPARQAGFQLLLRATHGDPRPRVNGRRNSAFV